MFGYVIPDKPNMFMKDYYLYKAFYCGLCKSIGKKYGQLMRFSTNYDITFLNVLYHAVLDKDIELSNEVCILNPVKKKSVIKDDELTQDIIDVNTILLHYKLVDDVIDNKSTSKKIIDRCVLKRRYVKAKAKYPIIDKIFSDGYDRLRVYEKANSNDIINVSDCFASMMKEITRELFKENFNIHLGNLMYAIGKWIYIIDAIDDIEEDFKEHKYNMFLVEYKYETKEKFFMDRKSELEDILNNCCKTIENNFDNINVTKYEGILTNILWYGIPHSTKEVLGGTDTWKKIRI